MTWSYSQSLEFYVACMYFAAIKSCWFVGTTTNNTSVESILTMAQHRMPHFAIRGEMASTEEKCQQSPEKQICWGWQPYPHTVDINPHKATIKTGTTCNHENATNRSPSIQLLHQTTNTSHWSATEMAVPSWNGWHCNRINQNPSPTWNGFQSPPFQHKRQSKRQF